MTVDTSRTIEIGSSPVRMLGFIMLGDGMTALAGAIALGRIGKAAPDSFITFIGWVGLLFFGLCTATILWRLVTERGAVVTLTPEGIRDVRVAAEFIARTAVQGISTWSSHGQRIIVLAVDQATEAGLTLSRIARWSRGANRSLGADGLCVTAQGLRMGYDDLLAVATAYHEAAERR